MRNKKAISVLAILLVLLMLASLIVSVLPVSAYADELEDLQAQRTELQSQMDECQTRIDALKEQQANALEQQAALNERNRLAEEELALIEKQIAEYDALIETKAEELEDAKTKEEKQLERYRTRVRAMEESGGFNILTLLLSADSFAEFITAMDDMGEIMDSDKELQEQYVEAREETEDIKAEYEEEKAEYEASKDDLKAEQDDINKKIEETNAYLEELADDIEKALEEYEAAQAAEQAAADSIAAMIAQLAAQKAAEAAANAAQTQQDSQQTDSSGTSTETDSGTSSSTSSSVSSTSGYVWPVPCSMRITSRFGYRSDPFTGQTKYHSGIDIDGFGNDGGAIIAAAAGTVITAAYSDGYGNYIIIDHGDSQTLYAHMSGFAVSQGSYVEQGQTIGYLGASGRATGTHCHFEVFVNGSRVDPAQYFSGMTYYNC